ncbi:hypothetical protein XAC3810_10082 [Xanthomonas citri pv. citri]|uniref:Uncharacterized protein n=1 Tax=Xanthomonas citri pv. citri TaxID=611301 RepID=A0A0U5F7T7_XANCI|nr:hypothetical protein XAC3824_10079 [Xanthomonas citri pv. citri]CEJ45219.1 hypothetical protein XAB3213_30043 [Xanthomonas citri pv. bilvae]CEE16246.1 hypothetical protein XAC9322_10082 [Xanthomonas citri pv. citri]CEE16269.1 hypothetical protein XAC1083_10082 [Xanthomonas citri pv. citri]CEE17009.1 hypothetical protein XAC902_10081 [Xanthomonas citri pv. citri]
MKDTAVRRRKTVCMDYHFAQFSPQSANADMAPGSERNTGYRRAGVRAFTTCDSRAPAR